MPSNESSDIYSNNTKFVYVTSLNVPIMFNGEFEAALKNIASSYGIEYKIGKINIEHLNDIISIFEFIIFKFQKKICF